MDPNEALIDRDRQDLVTRQVLDESRLIRFVPAPDGSVAPDLARKLGLTIEELKGHVEIIQHLDPKPGSRFNPQPSQYVIPDVYIIKVED